MTHIIVINRCSPHFNFTLSNFRTLRAFFSTDFSGLLCLLQLYTRLHLSDFGTLEDGSLLIYSLHQTVVLATGTSSKMVLTLCQK